ncbi:MAG: hypothetical protein A2321_02290 [Omnitrophica WOR_2 bacterium RIFOXYB2_FULL_45_11]|nr:hypothetical protein [Candidatus Omnitrophota bacterium]OGX49174.1 MAG: hypothetical protein A2216_02135 [Omnitrophica WOR_2 bacterium RIFOXYA2_FULL_45_12]OGX52384.1 MAG: hypothetical protein A2321_02290 [Omnitrophica WOR_2 bacterium RIFOXYB2_FULL_45_11]
MQTLKIDKNGTLVLPKIAQSIFRPSDKIAWFVDGDTFIVKKINPSKLSEIADRIKEKPLSLKEIVKEVHAYRKEKR